jgi:glycolate oxidase iron-sulfur subunit
MIGLAPGAVPPAQPQPANTAAIGTRRARVALLSGCVQSAIAPEIGHATIRVLAANGVDVVVPAGQGCCGALAMHAGDLPRARALARSLFAPRPGSGAPAFPGEVDAVVTNAAGCGSAMKEYGLLFTGEPEEARAREFASRVRDVSELLATLGLVSPLRLARPLTVAYHDACHLAHAQRVVSAPRELLRQVEGLTVVEIEEGDLCCGSAGTYNIEQPAIAETLGVRKAGHVLATGADAVVTGNIGCIVQIRTHLERQGRPLPVWHTMELLDRADAKR